LRASDKSDIMCNQLYSIIKDKESEFAQAHVTFIGDPKNMMSVWSQPLMWAMENELFDLAWRMIESGADLE